MNSFSKCACAMMAIVLMAGMASAADAISVGKVKSIKADKKEFVLTDAAGKDTTIKLGTDVVINRGGKETAGDLNENDMVNVCYDKGTFTSTAHYIVVQEGNSKNWKLMHGTFKGYDPGKKLLSFTDVGGTDLAFGWVHVHSSSSVSFLAQRGTSWVGRSCGWSAMGWPEWRAAKILRG